MITDKMIAAYYAVFCDPNHGEMVHREVTKMAIQAAIDAQDPIGFIGPVSLERSKSGRDIYINPRQVMGNQDIPVYVGTSPRKPKGD